MGKFTANWQNRVVAAKAKAVVDYGIRLGYSLLTKDCYWSCYEWCGAFYIGLNSDYDVWEADRQDIDDYCEEPAQAYLDMVAQEKATDAADKQSSIKYCF